MSESSSSLALPANSPERRWAAGVHLAALALSFLTSWCAGFAGILAGLVVLLLRPLNSDFVAGHAKEAFNFNLSMFLYVLAGLFLVFFTLGLAIFIVAPLAVVVALTWLFCTIRAIMAASDGEVYRYPLTIRIWQ